MVKRKSKLRAPFLGQAGVSLVELLVGIVIGLATIAVAYQAFEGVERNRRTVVSVGDVQVGGLYALFLTSADAGKAGMSFSANYRELAWCNKNLDTVFAPAPVLVNRGNTNSDPALLQFNDATGRDPNSDQIFISYAEPATLVLPVQLTKIVLPGDFEIKALAPVEKAFKEGDRVVISNGSQCRSAVVSADGDLDTGTGITTFKLTQAMDATFPKEGSRIVNLGADTKLTRQIYWLGNDGVFRRTQFLADGSTRVDPIFSNVERFRVQYGVGPGGSDVTRNVITNWEPPTGTWEPANVVASYANLGSRIKALRVSFILRAEEPERALAGQTYKTVMLKGCGGVSGCTYSTGEEVEIGPESGEQVGWRYRLFETVIPLRNNIWN